MRKGWILAFAGLAMAASCGGETVRQLPVDAGLTAFAEIAVVGGENEWGEEYQPFVGATAIDIDGDGKMEIFVGGGDGFDDMLFSYQEDSNSLINVIAGTGLSDRRATHGANSLDLDGDGDVDLILARNDGVFLYINQGGVFSRQQIPLNLPPNSTPLNVAAGDMDNDGDGDLYVSAFVDFAHFRSATYNDPAHAKTNVMLRNDGGLTFTDITESSKTASLQNTFLASFLDLNDDRWVDLVVAQNTGQVEIFQNLRDGTFAAVPMKTGWGFWMGLAAGDVDGDGDMDLFFSNSGTSVPAFLLELVGDGTDQQPRNYDWILLQNDGGFNFTEVTEQYQLDKQGFGWGAVFEDLTLDGKLELLVAQNYIKWPLHHWRKLPGKTFVLHDGKYWHAPSLGLENHAFAQSPLIVDMNNDGRPDVFWLAMEGVGRAFINRSPNNFVTLRFPDTVDSIGARAFIVTAGEKKLVREVHNNIGMSTDQMTALTFGLGEATEVTRVVIEWADGEQQIIERPAINQVIHVAR